MKSEMQRAQHPLREWISRFRVGRWLLMLPFNVRMFFLYGNCSCCGERRCNLVGPVWARHRLHALCRHCYPEGWTVTAIQTRLRDLGYIAVLLLVFGVACSGAQVRDAATCSPKAQAWWVAEMTRVCGALPSDKCPESPRIDAEFLRRECLECARSEEERAECPN